MRYLLPIILLACTTFAHAAHNQKDTLTNTNYVEQPGSIDYDTLTEVEQPLADINTARKGEWFDLYISNTYPKHPAISLDTLSLAPDRTVRYILNTRSALGSDNISAEAMYCANTSFNRDNNPGSVFKIYAYADTINNRWITLRQPKWKSIGTILNATDPVHATLYRVFCEDGLPADNATLRTRILERAGKYDQSK